MEVISDCMYLFVKNLFQEQPSFHRPAVRGLHLQGAEEGTPLSEKPASVAMDALTPRLKWLQRKLAGVQKGSRNRERIWFLLRKEYEKLNSRCRNAQNKVLVFLKTYQKVVFQEDGVKGWVTLFGRQVHPQD